MSVTDLDGRLRELKSAWESKNSANDEIVNTAAIEDGVLMIGNDRREAFTKNLAAMGEIKSTMDLLTEQKRFAEWGAQPVSESQALAAEAGRSLVNGRGRKSLGQSFTDSAEFKALQASGSGNMSAPWECKGVDMSAQALWQPAGSASKNVYGVDNGSSTVPAWGLDPIQRDDIVVQAFRKVRVRDLFPVQPTQAALIEFFRVTGFVAANNASPVPQWNGSNFGLANQTNLTFTGAQAPVRTIAHWEAAHRNVLNDVPQLQGIIDTELLYGLRLAEDNQILNGTGLSEDLTGILQTANIQSYTPKSGGTAYARTTSGSASAGLATDTKADDVRRAATKAILAYYEPTGVVMNPADWESIETVKDSTYAYVVAVAIAVGGQQRLWRLPVVDTPAIAQGTFLTGAFGLGATLYDREEGNIRIAEQHSDFFLRNAIVVLAEERLAMAVKRPESFVAGTFGV